MRWEILPDDTRPPGLVERGRLRLQLQRLQGSTSSYNEIHQNKFNNTVYASVSLCIVLDKRKITAILTKDLGELLQKLSHTPKATIFRAF